jgi:histidine triad (HIT) family protein
MAQELGHYEPDSIENDGFIHCSDFDQATERAANIYSGQKDLLLLEIDEELVKAAIVYEDLYGMNQMFPHMYGILNLEAVKAIYHIESAENGELKLNGVIGMDCLGCRIANGLEPGLNIIFETEWITCVLDIAPFNEGHTLILPKKHCWDVDEMDKATAHAIMDASIQISKVLKEIYKPDGISVCQNGGVFNDLSHYHMHIIPRFQGDGFSWSEPLTPNGAEQRLAETRVKMIHALT